MNILKTQITSPSTDVVLLLLAGIVAVLLGGDMILAGYGRVGGAFAFIGAVNLFNSWRGWRKLNQAGAE